MKIILISAFAGWMLSNAVISGYAWEILLSWAMIYLLWRVIARSG